METWNRRARPFVAALLVNVLVGSVWAGVVGSQHDFTLAGTAQGRTDKTDQVCVFCHTPHGAATDATAPLWNKVLGAPGSYSRYSTLATPTFDSVEAPVGSVSLACLSCHDGTQAMDVVINLPGSGGYNSSGTQVDPIAIGTMFGEPVPRLNPDLTDDHPISMQYGGGGVAATDPDGLFGGTLGDSDFVAPYKATVNGNPVWWVDSPIGAPGTREKTDMVLYARNDLGSMEPFVECGSCHDPHNDLSSGPITVAFLRIDDTANQICTSCHIK